MHDKNRYPIEYNAFVNITEYSAVANTEILSTYKFSP